MQWGFPASIQVALNHRTAVYGSVRTVVWQGGTREGSPYADHSGCSSALAQSTSGEQRLVELVAAQGAALRVTSMFNAKEVKVLYTT